MKNTLNEATFMKVICSSWDMPLVPLDWVEVCRSFLQNNEIRSRFRPIEDDRGEVNGIINGLAITSIHIYEEQADFGRSYYRLRTRCIQCNKAGGSSCVHIMVTLYYLINVKSNPEGNLINSRFRWESHLRNFDEEAVGFSRRALQLEETKNELILLADAPASGSDLAVGEMFVRLMLSGRTKEGKRQKRGARDLSMNENGLDQVPKGGWDESLKALVLRIMVPQMIQRANRPTDGYRRLDEPEFSLVTDDQVDALIEIMKRVPIALTQITNEFQWIGEVSVYFEWVKEESGDQRLIYRVGDEEMAVGQFKFMKSGSRCFFFNMTACKCGILSINAATMKAALTMPLLPTGLADEVRKRFAAKRNTLQLPLPEPVKSAQDIRCNPDVRAIITEESNLRKIQLQFSYQGHQIPAGTLGYHTVEEKGTQLHIYQDVEAEKAIRIALERRLYISWVNNHGHFQGSWVIGDAAEGKSLFLGRVVPVLLDMSIDYVLPQGDQFIAVDEPVDIIGAVECDGNNWLQIGIGFELEGKRIDLLPILKDLLKSDRLDFSDNAVVDPEDRFYVDIGAGRYAPIRVERLRGLVKPIVDLLQREKLTADGRLKVRATAFAAFEEIEESGNAIWRAGIEAKQILERIKNRFSERAIPETFKGDLRQYQKVGFDWLGFLSDLGLGGVLADDMGLGKTIQIIAHICSEKVIGRLAGPVLIVLPQNLLDQWAKRFEEFAPHLSVMTWYGSKRKKCQQQIRDFDIVMTTYKLVYLDIEILNLEPFPLMVMDETKHIKNSRSLFNKAQKHLNVARRIAVGGTPLENNLDEYWSCFDTVESGVLGSLKEFREVYGVPIQKNGDKNALKRLRKRMAPLWLRRRKDDVLTELPPKTIEMVPCPLSKAQSDLYEAVRAVSSDEIMQILEDKGIARSKNSVLSKLIRLRMACDSLRLIDKKSVVVGLSSKEQWIFDNVPLMVQEGRKIIIFSFFETMISRVETIMVEQKIAYSKLTGKMSRRAKREAEHDFKTGRTSVFLITLTSGGAGLDLPEGDTVVQIEPQFNPQSENQGNDRVHRIGQDKNVIVYRLIVPGTLEEQILNLQKRKIDLANAMFDGGDFTPDALTEEDIRALLAPISTDYREAEDVEAIEFG